MNVIISLLIPALIAVESGGNIAAIGDHGNAVVCLQIHAECIADVREPLCKSLISITESSFCQVVAFKDSLLCFAAARS